LINNEHLDRRIIEMANYHYEMKDGHIIFETDGREIMLDTGAPTSIGKNEINFEGDTYVLQDNYLGVSLETISEWSGLEFDVLMGMDIIGGKDLLIDPANNSLVFEDRLEGSGHLLELKTLMGIPMIEIEIAGETVELVLDTGAATSYLDPDLLEGLDSVDEREDYYPLIGRFNTPIYQLDVSLDEESIDLEFGRLPDLLQMTLMLTGCRGILGTQILQHFGYILSIPRGEVCLNKLERSFAI
jgi:hypothetical protein